MRVIVLWFPIRKDRERTSSLSPYLGHENSAGERVKPLSGMHLDCIEGCLNSWCFRGSTETSEPQSAK